MSSGSTGHRPHVETIRRRRQNSFKTRATGPPGNKILFKCYRKDLHIASVNVKGAETIPIATHGEPRFAKVFHISAQSAHLRVLCGYCRHRLPNTSWNVKRDNWGFKTEIIATKLLKKALRETFEVSSILLHNASAFFLFGKIYNDSQTNSTFSNYSKVAKAQSSLDSPAKRLENKV